MSKAAERIRRGLEQAIRYAETETSPRGYRVHIPPHVDVKAIRRKLGLTQQAFAARFGFSVTLYGTGSKESANQKMRFCAASQASSMTANCCVTP